MYKKYKYAYNFFTFANNCFEYNVIATYIYDDD